jgi:hypothetical protein
MASGDILINSFSKYFIYETYFYVSLFVKPYHYVPYGRSIYFQNSCLSEIKNEVPSL